MNIPVFHDDQHGTAIISGAALVNACEIAGKKHRGCAHRVQWRGRFGNRTARFYLQLGASAREHHDGDSKGVIHEGRTAGMNRWKSEFAVAHRRAHAGLRRWTARMCSSALVGRRDR